MVNLVIPKSSTVNLKNVHASFLSKVMMMKQDIYYTGTNGNSLFAKIFSL